MSVQIGICDDNAEDISILSEALYTYNSAFKILNYTDGESLLEVCRNAEVLFDILFLDIYMPGMGGIKTARKIRTFNKQTKIIFVSSSNEYYPEAYDVFAFNYIIKPLNREKLNHIVDQALSDIFIESQQQITLTYKGETHRVFYKDIQYIESKDKVLHFHLADRTKLQCYGKLDEMLKRLPEDLFIRCHQSFAVNIFHITTIGDNHFRIDPTVISISRRHLKAAKDKYFTCLFMQMNRGL